MYDANRITAAKAKRAARNSPAPQTNTIDAQAPPTCPRCQRIFNARISLLDILRRNAPTIRKCILLREILPTLLQTPPLSLLASIPLLRPSKRPHPNTQRLLPPPPQPSSHLPPLPPPPSSAKGTLF
ncbi:unnamed protein product [Schistocephalus solidus]|uniref:Uncharacterized protein n=1 Tax=Schistocephalus solidus TaxID=70667 RepID=A0A183T0N8_SCHSO|nr:unnamed protein product [Schistocephalus solidus]